MNLHLPSEFKSYKPNITFNIDTPKFIVKIAETQEELLNTFILRHNVFHKEWKSLAVESDLDIDSFDQHADHLIVIKKSDKQIVGTCRLTSSLYVNSYYTQEFFDINSFLHKKEGNKVEMSRMCTDKTLRSSQAVHCLWLGFSRYFRKTSSRYMFGCPSILTPLDEKDIIDIYKYLLKKKQVDKEIYVGVVKKYAVESSVKAFTELLQDETSFSKQPANDNIVFKLPRFLLWYLNMGAKVHGPIVQDPIFRSYDLFMSLDFKNIANPKLVSRYEDAAQLKKNLTISD